MAAYYKWDPQMAAKRAKCNHELYSFMLTVQFSSPDLLFPSALHNKLLLNKTSDSSLKPTPLNTVLHTKM